MKTINKTKQNKTKQNKTKLLSIAVAFLFSVTALAPSLLQAQSADDNPLKLNKSEKTKVVNAAAHAFSNPMGIPMLAIELANTKANKKFAKIAASKPSPAQLKNLLNWINEYPELATLYFENKNMYTLFTNAEETMYAKDEKGEKVVDITILSGLIKQDRNFDKKFKNAKKYRETAIENIKKQEKEREEELAGQKEKSEKKEKEDMKKEVLSDLLAYDGWYDADVTTLDKAIFEKFSKNKKKHGMRFGELDAIWRYSNSKRHDITTKFKNLAIRLSKPLKSDKELEEIEKIRSEIRDTEDGKKRFYYNVKCNNAYHNILFSFANEVNEDNKLADEIAKKSLDIYYNSNFHHVRVPKYYRVVEELLKQRKAEFEKWKTQKNEELNRLKARKKKELKFLKYREMRFSLGKFKREKYRGNVVEDGAIDKMSGQISISEYNRKIEAYKKKLAELYEDYLQEK